MEFLLIVPTILSLLLFCAHLFRSGALVFIPLVLLALPLLALRHGLVARFFQLLLVFVSAQWVLSTLFLVNQRAKLGEPWLRTAAILGCVALFAFFAAALFETPPLRRRYPRHFLG